MPDHLCRSAATRHINGNALTQVELVEVRGVLAEGLFRPAAAFTIVVKHAWCTALVDALEIVDIRDHGHNGSLSR